MAVSTGFLDFVLEQLEALGNVTSRRMFGGVGLYAGETFFGVLDNDTLFFKVDELTIGAYRDEAMPPFRPYPDKPDVAMSSYYQVPVRVLEDSDELTRWAGQAVDVAGRAAGRRGRSRRPGRQRTTPKRRSRR